MGAVLSARRVILAPSWGGGCLPAVSAAVFVRLLGFAGASIRVEMVRGTRQWQGQMVDVKGRRELFEMITPHEY